MQHTLYSVLSMVEPGTFDIDTMSDQTFSGVVLLMTLSNRMNPLVVFEKMLNSARQLAVTLGAELCDASRKPLTAQMMTHLRESIQKTHRRSLTHISSGASV
jgi:cell division protein ZipA